jgi:uncharacterized membrane protein YesL
MIKWLGGGVMMNRVSLSGIYSVTEWITRFVYINLLWIGFSLIGLIILGFFPATVSMFTVIRKWLMGETEIPIFQTFFSTFKKEFVKSNLLGLIVIIIGGLIVLDLVYMRNNGSSFTKAIHIPLYMFIFTFALTSFYLFPVYVHYDLKLFQVIKNSFFIMLLNPITNLIMLISLVTIFFVIKAISGIGFFFGGSISATVIMSACFMAFKKLDQKSKTSD